MNPFEKQKAFAEKFATLEDLILAIEKAELVSNQDASLINCEGELELEREMLSDRSIVFNIYLKP
jgi:hypothetical protein